MPIYKKKPLSESINGRSIIVRDVDTLIHITDSFIPMEEIWLYASNTSNELVHLDIKIEDEIIYNNLVSRDGLKPIMSGLVLQSGQSVKAITNLPNSVGVKIFGYVNSIIIDPGEDVVAASYDQNIKSIKSNIESLSVADVKYFTNNNITINGDCYFKLNDVNTIDSAVINISIYRSDMTNTVKIATEQITINLDDINSIQQISFEDYISSGEYLYYMTLNTTNEIIISNYSIKLKEDNYNLKIIDYDNSLEYNVEDLTISINNNGFAEFKPISYYIISGDNVHIDISNCIKLSSLDIVQNEPDNTLIKFFVSFDNKNSWRYWNGKKWIVEELINISKYGNTKEELEVLNENHWNAVSIPGYTYQDTNGGFDVGVSSYFDVAVCLRTGDQLTTPQIDQINLQAEMSSLEIPFTNSSNYIFEDEENIGIDDDKVQLFIGEDYNTKLLIHSNTENDSTTILNSSIYEHLITVNGNPFHDETQFAIEDSSIYFDGDDDYLSIPGHNNWNFNEDFTIDLWINLESQQSVAPIIGHCFTMRSWMLSEQNGKIVFNASNDGSNWQITLTSTLTLSINSWYHVAISRSGNVFRLYINGVFQASVTNEIVIYNTMKQIQIGSDNYEGGARYYFNGYIDELRISNGIARWTSNFTPPTVPYRYTSNIPQYVTTSDLSQLNTVRKKIIKFNITQSTPNNTSIKYLVSFDGRTTWKYWDGNSWEVSSLDDIQTNGMVKSVIEGLSPEQWVSSNGYIAGTLDVAIDLFSSEIQTTPYIENIEVDVKLNAFINFTTPENYSLEDETKLEITDGKGQLKQIEGEYQTNSPKYILTNDLSQIDFREEHVVNFNKNTEFYEIDGDLDIRDGVIKLLDRSICGIDNDTVLMIQSDENDSTSIFTDTSLLRHTITGHGDIHHKVEEKVFGKSSIYFDGVDDYLSIPSSSSFNFATDNFTIDFWVNFTSYNPWSYIISGGDRSNGNTQQWYLGRSVGNYLVFGYFNSSYIGANFDIIDTIYDNTWHHIALIRENEYIKIYYDGVNKYKSAFYDNWNIGESTVINTGSSGITIGAFRENGSYKDYFNGYIDELRISKNIARWTENFTPPTSKYETSILTGYINIPNTITLPITKNEVKILNININQVEDEETSIKYLLSFDGRTTWKYWDGDSWEVSSLDDIQTNGIGKNILEGISQANWLEIDASSVDIAISLNTNNNDITPYIEDIKLETIFNSIEGVKIFEYDPDETIFKYLLSFDGRTTWKYWDGDSWEVSSLDDIQTNGMTKTQIENLVESNWSATGGYQLGTSIYLNIAADMNSGSNFSELIRILIKPQR